MTDKIPTSLDPLDNKQALKEFLESQDEFTSYDFEGTGMSVLLDVLSRNNYYLAFLASMLGNEVTMTNAKIRSTVVAHAKRMSYTPHSKVASKAIVDIVVTPTDVNTAPSTLTLDKDSKFASSIDNEIFYFINTDYHTASLLNGVYTFKDVELYQGKYMSIDYTASRKGEQFEIPNDNVDTSHMIVSVQNSLSDTTVQTYTNVESLVDLDSSSNVYFLSENKDGKFAIEFGDGVFGKAISAGNIVRITYLVTKGENANGASRFDAVSAVKGFNNIAITTKQKSYGGKEKESIESIKFTAPKKNFSQNRAVTPSDYEPIVKRLIPQAIDVKAWGGEQNDPPNYGSVYIALKMPDGTHLTQSTKDSIVDKSLRKYSVATITPILVDADEIKMKLDVTVVYNKTLMVQKESDLENAIKNTVVNYSNKNLKTFGSRFRASKLTRLIDDSDKVIINSFLTNIELYKTVTATNGVTQSVIIHFGKNQIKKGTFYMDGFRVADPTTTQVFGKVYYIKDDNGVLKVYRNNEGTEVTVINNIGSIDYKTGKVSISNFFPLESNINLTAKVSPLHYDIEVIRGEILEIKNTSDVNVTLEGE